MVLLAALHSKRTMCTCTDAGCIRVCDPVCHYATTEQNMWMGVAVFNPAVCLLSFCVLQMDEIIEHRSVLALTLMNTICRNCVACDSNKSHIAMQSYKHILCHHQTVIQQLQHQILTVFTGDFRCRSLALILDLTLHFCYTVGLHYTTLLLLIYCYSVTITTTTIATATRDAGTQC
jgi:hypothetical protein